MPESGSGQAMERFWNERAREDAFYYVDSRQPLGSPDESEFWRAGEEVVDETLAALEVALHGDERVVEIGCGIGRVTRALSERARSVDALDVSSEMLEQAQKHNPDLDNVRWLHGDGLTLKPLDEGAFDACISFVVFQHIPDPEITLGYVREMGRVLRSGGWAAFQISQDPTVHERPRGLARLSAALREITGRGPRGQGDAEWLGSMVTSEQLERAAADGGLRIERVENPGRLFCLVLARRQ